MENLKEIYKRYVDELVDKWYEDCLSYDIPVSPSDVRDIIDNLILTKKEKENYDKDKF